MNQRKTTTRKDLEIRAAIDHEDFARIAGWLVQRSLDAVAGRDEKPAPPGMEWLEWMRARVDVACDVEEEADGGVPAPDDLEARQVSELWRLLDCLVRVESRMREEASESLRRAKGTRSGRPRKSDRVNALSVPLVPEPAPSAKAGRKRALPEVADADMLAHLERTKSTGKPERARLADLVREKVPEVRRRTGKSAEQHALTLAKRVSEARQVFRNRNRNAVDLEGENPNGDRSKLAAPADESANRRKDRHGTDRRP